MRRSISLSRAQRRRRFSVQNHTDIQFWKVGTSSENVSSSHPLCQQSTSSTTHFHPTEGCEAATFTPILEYRPTEAIPAKRHTLTHIDAANSSHIYTFTLLVKIQKATSEEVKTR